MLHKYKIYYFINSLNTNELIKINNKINLILRNYSEIFDEKDLKLFVQFCKKRKQKIFFANKSKLALKFGFDGLYIPSFNKLLSFSNLSKRANFKIIGSAHNEKEIITKQKQGCDEIFISPIFFTKKSKSYLDIIKFNKINLINRTNIIALGGINNSNYRKIKSTRSVGFASISWIKKTGLIN